MRSKRNLTTLNIAHLICNYKKITFFDICLKSRQKEIIEARQLAFYFCVEKKTDSYKNIGWKIGKKDHATVWYSHKTIKDRLGIKDKQTIKDVEYIENILNGIKNCDKYTIMKNGRVIVMEMSLLEIVKELFRLLFKKLKNDRT